MRQENDEAFCEGVPPLFEVLSSWGDEDCPISLSIVLQAESLHEKGVTLMLSTVSDSRKDI